jgi:hypothetical protein
LRNGGSSFLKYLFNNFTILQTSIRQRRSREEVQRWSNILKRWSPPVVHMGRPSRKNTVHEPITIFIRCLSTYISLRNTVDTAWNESKYS